MRETDDTWQSSLILGILQIQNGEHHVEKHVEVFKNIKIQIEELDLVGVWNLKPFYDVCWFWCEFWQLS